MKSMSDNVVTPEKIQEIADTLEKRHLVMMGEFKFVKYSLAVIGVVVLGILIAVL